MKKIVLLICSFTLFSILATCQEFKGGIGLHPIHNKLSWRSNIHKTHFWDYKLKYQAGSASGVPFINLSPQINSCWRKQNAQQLKLYWGIGMGLETFVPRFTVPIGIEFFPFTNIPQLSITTEVSPTLILLGPGMTTTTIKGDLNINYYFNRKQKQQ